VWDLGRREKITAENGILYKKGKVHKALYSLSFTNLTSFKISDKNIFICCNK